MKSQHIWIFEAYMLPKRRCAYCSVFIAHYFEVWLGTDLFLVKMDHYGWKTGSNPYYNESGGRKSCRNHHICLRNSRAKLLTNGKQPNRLPFATLLRMRHKKNAYFKYENIFHRRGLDYCVRGSFIFVCNVCWKRSLRAGNEIWTF